MGYTYYDYNVDPWNSDTPDYIHIQSAYYGGSESNITAPASPNYPLSAPTRYFLDMRWIIDVSALAGARPILLRDVTAGVNMTRVSGVPGANEYRIPTSASERRHTIELNAFQAGNVIGFDYYTYRSVLIASDFESKLEINGIIKAIGGFECEYRNSSGVESTSQLKTKIIEIGDWNMYIAGGGGSSENKNVLHNISNFKKIRSIFAIVRDDPDTQYYNLNLFNNQADPYLENGGVQQITTTEIVLGIRTGGLFDDASFNSTSYNRGWIYIIYEV